MSRVIMTVGTPRSGKTSYAQRKRSEGYVTLSLDDFRTMLFGSKKRYWRLHMDEAQSNDALGQTQTNVSHILNTTYNHALRGLIKTTNAKIVLANTHIMQSSLRMPLMFLESANIQPHLAVFLTPLEELHRRNNDSDGEGHVPPDYLEECWHRMNDPDAWWRNHPHEVIEQ